MNEFSAEDYAKQKCSSCN